MLLILSGNTKFPRVIFGIPPKPYFTTSTAVLFQSLVEVRTGDHVSVVGHENLQPRGKNVHCRI